VSNGPWGGASGKRAALHNQSALLLNAEIDGRFGDDWSSSSISARTEEMVKRIIEIWPVPAGHRIAAAPAATAPTIDVSVPDLLAAGMVEDGETLVPVFPLYEGRSATIRGNGSIELDSGEVLDSLSAAGKKVHGWTSGHGWTFWKVAATGKKMAEIRDDFRARFDLLISDEEDSDELDEVGELVAQG
jgi:hypothetical protein